MELATILDTISNFGFPIALVLVLGWFVFKIYTDQTKTNKENLDKVQAESKEREAILYSEIKANREVNAQAITTIALYADKLDTIQHDVSDIKTDLITLNERVNK